nr:MAG TPA: hypothetical protein [Caudoviricetes sp.]
MNGNKKSCRNDCTFLRLFLCVLIPSTFSPDV